MKMFVVRGKNGEIITSTAWNPTTNETNEQEIQHKTYEQAEKALKELEKSLPKGLFQVVPLPKG